MGSRPTWLYAQRRLLTFSLVMLIAASVGQLGCGPADRLAEGREVVVEFASKANYLRKLGGAIGDYTIAIELIGKDLNSASIDEVQTARNDLDGVLDKLNDIEPPVGMRGSHNAFVNGIKQMQVGLGSLAKAKGTDSQRDFDVAKRQLDKANKQIERALVKIAEDADVPFFGIDTDTSPDDDEDDS